MSGLIADNLAKSFAGQNVVAGFDIELQKGEVVGLLGPNGAGKSTALQMLAGCLQADSGHVSVNGQSLKSNRALQHKIGYLPENPPLHDTLTVFEQLAFSARLYGVDMTASNERCRTVMDLCELSQVQDRLIGQLSRGFRQRTGIAQALMHEPEYILLDEPTDGLDPRQIQSLRQLIRQLGQDHAVLLSSHLLTEVEQTCDSVMIMHEGEVIFRESLAELIHANDTLEKLFIRLIYQDAEARS